jgi:hypothetical protein
MLRKSTTLSSWHFNEPSENEFDFSRIDYLASAARTQFRNLPADCSGIMNATVQSNCTKQINSERIKVFVYYANIQSLKLQEVAAYPVK